MWVSLLSARGSVRLRRARFGRCRISLMVSASALQRVSGGKIRLPCDLAADDSKTAHEG